MASPERVSLRYGDCRAEVLLREGRYALCAAAMDARPFGRLILPCGPSMHPVLFPRVRLCQK